MSPLVREFGLWNLDKVLLVDSGILGNLCLWNPEFLGFEFQNTTQGSRGPTNDPSFTDRY